MATLEQIQARMKKLQVQAEALIARRAQAALDQIREIMLKHGLTTEDIEAKAKARRERVKAASGRVVNGKVKAAATKGKLPPKYRDPKTGATWSGHARPPAWIKNVKAGMLLPDGTRPRARAQRRVCRDHRLRLQFDDPLTWHVAEI